VTCQIHDGRNGCRRTRRTERAALSPRSKYIQDKVSDSGKAGVADRIDDKLKIEALSNAAFEWRSDK
jgi:hypothetical protein